MKTIYLSIFFCCYSLIATSQTTIHQVRIDELSSKIEKTSSDVEKLELLLEQAKLYNYQVFFDEEKETLERALSYAQKLNDPSKLINVYLSLGAIFPKDESIINSKNDACQRAYELAKELDDIDLLSQAIDCQTALIELSDKKKALANYKANLKKRKEANLSNYAIATAYYNLAKASIRLSTLDKPLEYIDKAIALLEPLKEKEKAQVLLGKVYREKAYYHTYLNIEIEKSTEYLNQSLKIFSELKNLNEENITRTMLCEYLTITRQFSRALDEMNLAIKNSNEYVRGLDLSTMGLLSFYNGNKEEALDYYLKSYEKFQLINNKHEGATAECSIAFMYSSLKEYEKGIPYLEKAKAYAEEVNDSTLMSNVFASRAKLYSSMEDYPKSIASRKRVVEIDNAHKNEEHAAYQSLMIASEYIKLNELDSALYYNQQSFDYYKDTDMKHPKKSNHLFFKKIYKLKGDYKNSLEHFEKFKILTDSIVAEDLQKRLNEERVNMKVVEAAESVNVAEEKTAQAERETALLARQKTLYSILAFLLLGILLVGGYLYNQLKKTKEKVESQNLQLQQLNTTKDKFFGIIAHDIRSPIVALDGVGEQMEYYLEKDKKEKLTKLASRVDSTAKRLSGLLDNLLNWALLQQGVIPYHPKSLNVKSVSEDVLGMFQNNAKAKDVELVTDIDSNLKVHADESAMQTILRNLVSNAIKFTPAGGKVSISTETKDDKVFININDTGTGISAEKISKLFSLEKQSEKGTAGEKGTGLGLTLVKELAELNKGILAVKSRLNEGSQFSVGLPLV